MIFNVGKCKCMHTWPGNAGMNYEMGGTILRKTVKEKYLGLWVTMDAPVQPGFLFGGGTRPTPPSLASVVQTFEAVAGSWGSVSAPAASRVMGGAPERNKNSNLICR